MEAFKQLVFAWLGVLVALGPAGPAGSGTKHSLKKRMLIRLLTEFLLRLQERSGCEKPDTPTLFYRGEVYGTKGMKEIVEKLPQLFPKEAAASQIMDVSTQLPDG